jgi:glycosyl transferase family 87
VRATSDPATRILLLRLGVVIACVTGLAVLPFGLYPALVGRLGSGDFQWSGAHLLVHGRSAFVAALQEGRSGLLRNQNPNYLHLLYFAFAPLGAMSFSMARVMWATVNLVMALVTALLLARAAGFAPWQRAGLVGLFMSSGPFIFALEGGQQTFLVMLCSTAAFMTQGRAPLTGLSLALAMTKYSFAPVTAGLWLRGRKAVVAWSAGISVVAWLAFAWVTHTSVTAAALGPLQVGRTMARGSADVMTLTGMAIGSPRASLTYAAAFVVGTALAWFARDVLRRGSWIDALSACFLVSLVTFPHLLYDYTVLLPVLVSGLRMSGAARWFVVGVVSLFWFNWVIGGLPFPAYHATGVTTSFLLLVGSLVVIVRTQVQRRPGSLVLRRPTEQEVRG